MSAMLCGVRDRLRSVVLPSVTTLVGRRLWSVHRFRHAAMRPGAMSVGFCMLFSIPVILILMPCIVVSLNPYDRRKIETWHMLRDVAYHYAVSRFACYQRQFQDDCLVSRDE